MKARDVIANELRGVATPQMGRSLAQDIEHALLDAGLCIVPREATPEMIHNADIVVDVAGEGEFRIHWPPCVGPEDVYRAMIAAYWEGE